MLFVKKKNKQGIINYVQIENILYFEKVINENYSNYYIRFHLIGDITVTFNYDDIETLNEGVQKLERIIQSFITGIYDLDEIELTDYQKQLLKQGVDYYEQKI